MLLCSPRSHSSSISSPPPSRVLDSSVLDPLSFLGSGSFSASARVSRFHPLTGLSVWRTLWKDVWRPRVDILSPAGLPPHPDTPTPHLRAALPFSAWSQLEPGNPALRSYTPVPAQSPQVLSFFEPPTVSTLAFSLLPFLLGPDILYSLSFCLCLSSLGTPVCQLICACLSLTPFTGRCTTHRNIHTHTDACNHMNTHTYTHTCMSTQITLRHTDKHTQIYMHI